MKKKVWVLVKGNRFYTGPGLRGGPTSFPDYRSAKEFSELYTVGYTPKRATITVEE